MPARLPPVPSSAPAVRDSAAFASVSAAWSCASWPARSWTSASRFWISAPSSRLRSLWASSSVTELRSAITLRSSASRLARVLAMPLRSSRSWRPAARPAFSSWPRPATPPPSSTTSVRSFSRVGWSKVLTTSSSSVELVTAVDGRVAPEDSVAAAWPGSSAT